VLCDYMCFAFCFHCHHPQVFAICPPFQIITIFDSFSHYSPFSFFCYNYHRIVNWKTFVHIICIVIFWSYLKYFILVTFSNDILDVHVTLSSIMDAIWMKTCNEKKMSSFILPCYNLLVKCTINIYDYKFFPHRIWSNILWLKSII